MMKTVTVTLFFMLATKVGSFRPFGAGLNRSWTSLRVCGIDGTRSLGDNSSLEKAILDFSSNANDEARRDDFEAFVREGVAKDFRSFPFHQSSFKRLPFVVDLNESMTRIGQSAQDDVWEQHVIAGFQLQERQLWPFVDMLVQFKVLVKNLEASHSTVSLPKRKQGGCGCAGCPGRGHGGNCNNGVKARILQQDDEDDSK